MFLILQAHHNLSAFELLCNVTFSSYMGSSNWSCIKQPASKSSLHPPAGIWCDVLARWCWCSPCCVWRWCSTWWRRAAGCRTHTACPDPSRQRRGCGPAARRRCRPAERPWAGSAAGTTPWTRGEVRREKMGSGRSSITPKRPFRSHQVTAVAYYFLKPVPLTL